MKYALILLLCCTKLLHAQLHADISTQPKVKWRYQTATKKPIVTTAAVDENTIYIGSTDSILYALTKEGGKEKWRWKSNGPIRSNVLLDKDRVFINAGDGHLYCLNKNTGKMIWSFQTLTGYMGDRRYDIADHFQSSPVLYNNIIYFGSSDGNLYAVNATSGKRIWRFETQDIIHAAPAVNQDKVIVSSFDGHVYCLDNQTGTLIWRFKSLGHRFFPKGEMMGAPVINKDLVFVGGRDYNVYALDLENGHCHWVKSFPGGWALAITPNDSVVHVGTSDDRVLITLDHATGRTLWKTDVKFNILSPCTLTKGMAYASTLMGKVYGINLKDGSVSWIFTTDGYNARHLKYFKEDDSFRDDVFKIVKTPEDALQAYVDLGGIFSSPVVSKDIMIVATYDGSVYCLKP